MKKRTEKLSLALTVEEMASLKADSEKLHIDIPSAARVRLFAEELQ